MNTTAAAVILLFVISIFSGFGGNKGYKQPSGPVFPVDKTVSQPVMAGEPAPRVCGGRRKCQTRYPETYCQISLA